MLTMNWMLPLFVCVGPVILGLLFVYAHRFFAKTDETIAEVVVNRGAEQLKKISNARDEQRWVRAYGSVALSLPK